MLALNPASGGRRMIIGQNTIGINKIKMKNMKLQINYLNNQIRLLRTFNLVKHKLIIRSLMNKLISQPTKLILPNDI